MYWCDAGPVSKDAPNLGPIFIEQLPDKALPWRALCMGAVPSLMPSAAALHASQTALLHTQVTHHLMANLAAPCHVGTCCDSALCSGVWVCGSHYIFSQLGVVDVKACNGIMGSTNLHFCALHHMKLCLWVDLLDKKRKVYAARQLNHASWHT